MPKKLIHLVVENCYECPYCHYEGWNEAFFCKHLGGECRGMRKLCDIYPDEAISFDQYVELRRIPTWCPLENCKDQ